MKRVKWKAIVADKTILSTKNKPSVNIAAWIERSRPILLAFLEHSHIL